MKTHRSKGAPYVKSLRHNLLWWEDDGIPKLIWAETWAIHVSATGEARKIYGLAYADAKAMAKIHGLQFTDRSSAPVLRT